MSGRIAVSIYVLIAVVGGMFVESRFLWLVFLGGSILLVDQYSLQAVRRLPRRLWLGDAIKRLGFAVCGAACAALLLGRSASWRELAFAGGLAGLGSLVLEQAIAAAECVFRRWRTSHGDRRFQKVAVGAVLALPLLLAIAAYPTMSTLHPLRQVPYITPADLGLGFEEVSFVARDGTRLCGWIIPAEDVRATVVFCHGHKGHRGHVLNVLPELHQAGCEVLAFDFRGHGQSQGHTTAFGSHETQDVAAACRLAKLRRPDRPMILMGVSYGAAVSLQALPELPDVAAAWIEAPFASFASVAEYRYRSLPPGVRTALLRFSYSLAWLDTGIWPADIAPIASLGHVGVPIWFVHGRNDDIIPFSDTRLLWQRYEGPKDRFWPEAGGHCDLHATCGTEYGAHLRRFLKMNAVDLSK